MMEDLCIERIEDSPFLLNDVFDFIRRIYAKRKTQGIDFWLSTCSFHDYEERVKEDSKTIFVAFRHGSNDLYGTASLTIRVDKKGYKYCGMTGCAVREDIQHQRIGSRLIEKLRRTAIEEGCEYLLSTTAVNATSSVKWHLKNGFLKYGLASSSKSHYYSYVFIMPLVNTDNFYFRFGYKIHYAFSSLITKSLLNENGDYTWLGKVLKTMVK